MVLVAGPESSEEVKEVVVDEGVEIADVDDELLFDGPRLPRSEDGGLTLVLEDVVLGSIDADVEIIAVDASEVVAPGAGIDTEPLLDVKMPIEV